MSIRCLISFASLFVLCVLVACAGTSKTSPRAWGDGARGAERAAPEIIDELLSSLSASAEACGRGQADGCTRILRHTVNGAPAAARIAYVAAFEAGCEQGVPAACGGWGMAQIWERGAPRRNVKGLSLLERGCEGRSPDSCVLLAQVQLSQTYSGIEPNAERAVSLLTESCESSGGSPCQLLSQLYRSGNHVPTDHEKAKQLLDKACHTGSARACYSLAGDASVKLRDHGYAKVLLSKACENLLGDACHDMAWQHVNRNLEKWSRQTAIELFARSCALGDSAGCDFLALTNHGATIYDDATTKAPAWQEAQLQDHDSLSINRKYCSYGGGKSCFKLVETLARLSGETDVTAEEMVQALQSACAEGNIKGCNILGHVSKDFIRLCEQVLAAPEAGEQAEAGKETEQWTPEELQKAARIGCAFAGFGYLYGVEVPPRHGRSVARDKDKAIEALQRSCEAGSNKVCARLKKLVK